MAVSIMGGKRTEPRGDPLPPARWWVCVSYVPYKHVTMPVRYIPHQLTETSFNKVYFLI